MAMSELILVWLGSVALGVTALAGWSAMHAERVERWTRVLFDFAASLLWGLFAVSAMDVVMPSGASTPVSEPVYPMVYLGIGFALVTFAYALYDMTTGVASEAQEADLEGFGRVR